jgi:UDP-N-acetylmuramyl pentapeptide phosphotransferase/UDP-N-acetylglucosamine-1-phosphate transferase
VRPFARLVSVAQARLRHAGQRLGLRAALIAGCVLAGAVFLGFTLAAITVVLAARLGTVAALAIMAGVALFVALGLMVALSIEAQRERRIAARRASLDRELLRTAAISAAVPRASRLPGRAGLGLGLVALGALLVLARRREDDED